MNTLRMQRSEKILVKLKAGIKFGLYENGKTCYLADGSKVDYEELWRALRLINNLKSGHNMSLMDLCPSTFQGNFQSKFRYRWIKRIWSLFLGRA